MWHLCHFLPFIGQFVHLSPGQKWGWGNISSPAILALHLVWLRTHLLLATSYENNFKTFQTWFFSRKEDRLFGKTGTCGTNGLKDNVLIFSNLFRTSYTWFHNQGDSPDTNNLRGKYLFIWFLNMRNSNALDIWHRYIFLTGDQLLLITHKLVKFSCFLVISPVYIWCGVLQLLAVLYNIWWWWWSCLTESLKIACRVMREVSMVLHVLS